MTEQAPENRKRDFIDLVDHGAIWLRERINTGIEWLVRFCELLLLAGAFQYAFRKTHDLTIGILSLLLSCAALFYVFIFVNRVSNSLNILPSLKWWRLLIAAAGVLYFGWLTYQMSLSVQDAINAVATSNIVTP